MDWFLYDNGLRHERVKRQSRHHIETSQSICSANQLTGFYMMAALVFNELILEVKFGDNILFQIKNTPQGVSAKS